MSVFTETISNGLPRVFLVTRWSLVDTEIQHFPKQQIWSNAFHHQAWVEFVPGKDTDLPAPPAADNNTPSCVTNAVRAFAPKRNSVYLEVETPCRSLLVLNDTWCPGWRAFVDGKQQPIYRANLWFRGVFLEPGKHAVKFVYRPSHLWLTTGVSLVGMGFLSLCWLWGGRKSEPGSATESTCVLRERRMNDE